MPVSPISPYAAAPVSVPGNGASEREQLRACCAEMEAMFVNHLMKAMRRTVPDADAGFARETWTALRDAELSRTVAAERGLGLQALLMRQLAPTPATSDGADAGPSNAPADAGPLEKPAEKSTDPPEFR